MSSQPLRFCCCSGCRAHRTFDPLTGDVLAGQYIPDRMFKEHRQRDNVVRVAVSHFQHTNLGFPTLQPVEAASDPDPIEAESSFPALLSDANQIVLRKLRSISSKLAETNIEHLEEETQVIFRSPPLGTSPPMSDPLIRLLELEPSCSANSNVVRYERLLQSATSVVDNIIATTDVTEILEFAHGCRELVETQTRKVTSLKWRQWERIRREAQNLPSQVRRVNTVTYIARPFAHMHPFILVCYFIVAFMHLIALVSLDHCRILLLGLRKLASMTTSVPANLPHRDLQVDIPRNAVVVLSYLDLEPKTKAYVCCAKCFHLYPYDPDHPGAPSFPSRCPYRRTPSSPPCNATLHARKPHSKKESTNPIRLFLHHELEDWVAELYSRLKIEDLLDREFRLEVEEEIWDVCESPELVYFLGPENDPDRPFLKRPGNEGRLIFSLNMDGFNPFSNKESGKKVTVGAIYLVCLTLPASIRFDLENIFLVGIIPGPKEPLTDQINHILAPLVDDLLVIWTHGFFLTSTAKYPHGRLVRGALIPLICDLPAARQMSGYASHSSHHFCCLCLLLDSDIDNLDPSTWPVRTREEHMKLATAWRDAPSESRRVELFKLSGVRWWELLRLPYWDPTRYVMIDTMHGFFLGMFQRHCRRVWGMSVKISDVDYPSFTQERDRPSDEAMQAAQQTFRFGSNDAIQKLPAPVLRELARSTNTVPYGGRVKKVAAALLAYRVDRGWIDDSGAIIGEDDPAIAPILPPQPPQPPQPTQPTQPPQPPQPPQPAGSKKRPRDDPPTQAEIAEGTKILESGSKSKLSGLRRALLVHLCQVKDIEFQTGVVKDDLVALLGKWRLSEGIVNAAGQLVARPERERRKKETGVLGSQTLKEVRADMDRLILLSWVAPAPHNAGDPSRGKFTADQWRTFCTINLTLTLNRLWGQEPAQSRRRQMLDNFMHLVTAVKIASMKCVTPANIAGYKQHISAYLDNLITLYPNTAMTPYQHLSLHIPRFLEGFGSVQAWRCFPFERFNYVLQGMPTNMKFGDLERTMLKKFCMAQKLKQRLDPTEVPEELEELVVEWKDVIESQDIRGTRVHEAFDYDPQFYSLDETVTWKKDDMQILSPCWSALLRNWIREHDSTNNRYQFSASVYIRSRISRLGEVYQPEGTSSNNSHVYYREGASLEAGTITGIFSHSRQVDDNGTMRTQTFFVLKQFQHLPPQYHIYDAYRRFPVVGGRLFREAYYEGETIVSASDVLYHFAYARTNIPTIPFTCIVALPLSR